MVLSGEVRILAVLRGSSAPNHSLVVFSLIDKYYRKGLTMSIFGWKATVKGMWEQVSRRKELPRNRHYWASQRTVTLQGVNKQT